MDINRDEYETLYAHLKRYLKHFETTPTEKSFWNETYQLDQLILIKNKLKRGLESA